MPASKEAIQAGLITMAVLLNVSPQEPISEALLDTVVLLSLQQTAPGSPEAQIPAFSPATDKVFVELALARLVKRGLVLGADAGVRSYQLSDAAPGPDQLRETFVQVLFDAVLRLKALDPQLTLEPLSLCTFLLRSGMSPKNIQGMIDSVGGWPVECLPEPDLAALGAQTPRVPFMAKQRAQA